MDAPTVFTLTVTDSAGLVVSKQVDGEADSQADAPRSYRCARHGGGTTVIPPRSSPARATPPPQ